MCVDRKDGIPSFTSVSATWVTDFARSNVWSASVLIGLIFALNWSESKGLLLKSLSPTYVNSVMDLLKGTLCSWFPLRNVPLSNVRYPIECGFSLQYAWRPIACKLRSGLQHGFLVSHLMLYCCVWCVVSAEGVTIKCGCGVYVKGRGQKRAWSIVGVVKKIKKKKNGGGVETTGWECLRRLLLRIMLLLLLLANRSPICLYYFVALVARHAPPTHLKLTPCNPLLLRVRPCTVL